MELTVHRWDGFAAPREDDLAERLRREGFGSFCWTDPPDADYPPHSHERDESIWVLRGEISFGVGDAEHKLHSGDRLMLPAGTVHTAHAGPEGATYLIGERS